MLLLAAAILGSAANRFGPRRIAWVQDWTRHVTDAAQAAGLPVVTLAETHAIVAAGTYLIFDARATASYTAGHLPGAFSMPADDLATHFPAYAAILAPETAVLVYCSGAECDESVRLGQFLREQGCTNVVLFADGYAAWPAAEGASR